MFNEVWIDRGVNSDKSCWPTRLVDIHFPSLLASGESLLGNGWFIWPELSAQSYPVSDVVPSGAFGYANGWSLAGLET